MNQNTPPDDVRIEPPGGPDFDPGEPRTEERPPRRSRAEPSPDWARDALLDMARHGLVEQRRARRWKVFFRFVSVALVVWSLTLITLLFTAGDRSAPGLAKPTAAVIDISGLIAAGETTEARRVIPQLEKAFEEDNVKGIVLRLNTPGGSPVQSSAIFNAIRELKQEYPDKPVYAVAEDMAASGGYFIAAAADEIYANPSSIVGSIGVRMDSFGFVDAMEKLGIERRLLTAGENKALGDPFSPSDPEETEYLQGVLGEIHEQFIEAVKTGRGDRLDDDETIFTGLFYTGETALEIGLIDGIDSVRGVIRDRIGVEHQIDLTPRSNRLEKLLGATAEEFGSALTGVKSEPARPMMLP
ncbi:S49 family peptidase [Guyparkeria sp. SCN-R1]|uniref:S49 family peptidase n=1 Tax=Guyparkeria sp. SCN-R1 TaxID=2341113 RepID=UPI000F64706C|nr:S49 family peptidase [Guyparkeria sp. SCN-R1]RRQ24871.1 S49 family peptidase [Guyparkeria sp. SCN-R1]